MQPCAILLPTIGYEFLILRGLFLALGQPGYGQMKTAYFDCFSGISGDMVLGALVDAGASLAQIEADLRRLPVSGWKISAKKLRRGSLVATRILVETSEQHHHRSLSTI